MIVRTIRFGLLVSILTAIGHASPASAAAILSVTPTSLTLQANTGSNVANRLVTVSNTGNGALNWSVVAPTATWLTVLPTSGKDAGTLTLTFRTSALAAGTYQTSFAVKTNSGSSVTVTVKVTMVAPSTALAGVSVTPAAVTGGAGSTGTVTLATAAPAGGAVVTLASSNLNAATVPASVTVAANATTATFAIATKAVTAVTAVTITATRSGVAKTATLTVNPPSTTAPTGASTFYVSTTGADTNPGTQSSPFRTIQKAVLLANTANAAGQASSVVIAAGTYRETVDLGLQKTDAALIIGGAGPSTVLTGADVWSTGWTSQADGSLVHSWPYQWGMKAVPSSWSGYWNWDGNGYKRDVLRRSEMIYVNGSPLRGVLTLAELSAAGTFYVDEGAAKLYMRLPAGISLSGSTVEVGMRVNVLKMSGRRNVTLRNFSVLRSRGGLQDTALLINASSNVVVENVQVRWHAYAGMGATSSSGVRITKSVFSDNGVYGTGCFKCLGIVLEDSEVARNNWRGDPVGHTGYDVVFKWGGTRDGVVRRSRFFDNLGGGIWFDGDNLRMLVEDSFSARNKTHGVFVEANGGPITVRRTKMCENGTDGMMNSRSNNLTMDGNQLFNNGYWQIATTGNNMPLTVTDWQTGQTYVTDARNWTITNNTVVGRPLASGAVPGACYPGPCGWMVWFLSQYDTIAKTVTSNNNRWYHTSTTKSFRVPDTIGRAVDQPTFRGLMSTMKINELNSTWGNPGTLSCTP
jgi:Right handed beta helix region/Viral BACON domain/Protein of unknown function (DUF1565)